MLTKPFPNLTHKNPFFSRKIGLADIIRLGDSTQLSSDSTQLTVDASRFLQSPESVSHGVGGSTRIEFQSLPTSRLRRPDTETGQRVPMTSHSESTRFPSRNPMPESEIQPAKKSVWKTFSIRLVFITALQTEFAIGMGGVGGPHSLLAGIFGGLYLIAAVLQILSNSSLGLEESRNP